MQQAVQQDEKPIFMGDQNCKVGKHISHNREEVSKGGRLLLNHVKKYNPSILNAEKLCKGTWTGREGSEKSIIDYIITKQEDVNYFTEIIIDENKYITPYRVEKRDDGTSIKYTDHNMMICKANWCIATKVPQGRKRMDPSKYEEFAKKLKESEISRVIDGKNLNATYVMWSEKILQTWEKYTVTQKKAKHNVNNL